MKCLATSLAGAPNTRMPTSCHGIRGTEPLSTESEQNRNRRLTYTLDTKLKLPLIGIWLGMWLWLLNNNDNDIAPVGLKLKGALQE